MFYVHPVNTRSESQEGLNVMNFLSTKAKLKSEDSVGHNPKTPTVSPTSL